MLKRAFEAAIDFNVVLRIEAAIQQFLFVDEDSCNFCGLKNRLKLDLRLRVKIGI